MQNLLAYLARIQTPRMVRAPLGKLRKASAILLVVFLPLIGLPNPVLGSGRVKTLRAATALQTAAGDLDSSFGTGGSVLTDFEFPSIGDAIAVQPDGKLVVVGFSLATSSGPTTIPGSEVARYNSDGTPDSTFGDNGIVNLLDPPGLAIFAVAIQSNGSILLAGAEMPNLDEGSALLELVRLNANGSLDITFGAFGTVTNGSGVALSMALQPNGQIVVAGLINSGGVQMFGVARYNENGSVDAAFGNGGEATLPLSAALSVAVQSDGKVVVGGVAGLSTSNNITGFPNILSGGQFAMVRLNTDGSLDTSFGSGGMIQTGILNASAISQIAIQIDGKIIAAGTAETSAGLLDFALVRYNTDGSLDTSFGNGGIVTTNIDGNDDVAFGLALQVDGQIVVAGSSFSPADQPGNSGLFFFPLSTLSGTSIALARYNSNGGLDSSFGSGGTVITPLQQGVGAFSVVIPQDGKIAVAGATSTGSGAFEFALAQYDAGTLAGDFVLLPSTLSATLPDGSSTTLTVGVQTAAGSSAPAGDVTLSATALPTTSGITATFSPSAVAAGGSSSLSIATSASTTTGVFQILITGTAGSITHSATLTVNVTGKDWSLSMSAPTITTMTSLNVFPRVVITDFGGFNGKVTVTAPKTGLPAGIQLLSGAVKTRRKNLVIKYRYKVTASTAPGTYLFTFTGTDTTGRVRSTTFTLIVQAATTSATTAETGPRI
jgi:uncharacterized delta-60 repeat protein